MGDRLVFGLGYGALFVSAVLWGGYCLWRRDRLSLAARGCNALAAMLLAAGLGLRGFRLGYWPLHTAYEVLHVGLLGLALATLTFLSLLRDGLLGLALAVLGFLVAVYGWLVGGQAGPATLVYDSGWWVAYVALCGFGGGALAVAGVALVVAQGRGGGNPAGEWSVARRALAWGLLALSAGLASGAWWFHRLSGRYWGDARWVGVLLAWLLTAAVWHGREQWPGRGWRSALVGVGLGLLGGYVLLGLGGGG